MQQQRALDHVRACSSSSRLPERSRRCDRTRSAASIERGAQGLYRPKLDIATARFVSSEIADEAYFKPPVTPPRAGDVIVDVGANAGLFALDCSRRVGRHGMVIAMEPQPAAFLALERNAATASSSRNIVPIRCAIGSAAGEGTIHSYRFATGWGTLHPSERSVRDDGESRITPPQHRLPILTR